MIKTIRTIKMMNNGKSTQKGRFFLCNRHCVSMMLRSVLLMVMMIIGGVNSAWGQVPEITTDTNGNGVIDDGEKKLYMIQTNAFQSFYIAPQADNTITTNNILGDYMLWYFLDADEDNGTQYYYIVSYTENKYVCHGGGTANNNTQRGVSLVDKDASNEERCKFYLELNETNGTTGFYNIDAKGKPTYYGLNKRGASEANTNPIMVTNKDYINDINSKWKFIPYNGTFTWPAPPFELSTDADKHYYKIRNVQSNAFYVSTDATPDKVTYSNAESNSMVWYFKEAPSDPSTPWFKYYYIVNPKAEDKYMYYSGTANDGSDQAKAVSVKAYDSNDEDHVEDRYQFVVIQAAKGDGNSRVICYAIIPKLLRDTYWGSNSIGSTSISNGTNMGIISSRSTGNPLKCNAHWQFVTTNYPLKCVAPTITYSSATGKITIASTTSGNTIHYTTDGVTEPTSSVGTQYTAPFDVSGPITIKAIATKTGFDDSEVTTKSFEQVATPYIQDNGSNAISITCATEGATIYYSTDGSTPSTEYTGPLTENVSGVTIKAIAKKDGMINSTVESRAVTLRCAKPVIAKSGGNVTISCNFPASGVSIHYTKNGGNPTSSSDLYSGAIPVSEGDVIKAIAIATGYNDSEVATKTIRTDLTPTDGKYLINNSTDFEIFVDMASEADGAGYHYVLKTDVDASTVAAITQAFSGIFDGDNHTITGLSHPLFNTVDGGVVKNVNLQDVRISQAGSVGAIAGTASSYSRIYNCGILPTDNKYVAAYEISYLQSSGGTNSYCGGLVCWLKDDSRVINCFSFANITGGTDVAGIVGHNEAGSTTAVTNEGGNDYYKQLRTAVVNCMFYGNITGGTNRYPVYGGAKMVNNTSTGINNYDFYRAEASVGTLTDYNCSWPAKEEYLTKYEFYRNLLNSNRELCGWWVGAPSAPSTMSTTAVQEVAKDASLMAKWVLDTEIAPYPILKKFGKYSSPVNIDAEASWRTTANEWEGKKLGTLKVTINPGDHAAGGASTKSEEYFVITDMDTLRADYCYRKIQLPYYNTVFGNPNSANWADKYGGNYGDYGVIGWEITSTNGASGTFVNSGEKPWQDGYNFADRKCSDKDKYSVSGRIFAQGGFYYVPDDVTEITITAHWASAIYLDITDRYYDRVSVSSYKNDGGISVGSSTLHPFAPAGTRPETLGNGKTVQNGSISSTIPSGGSVYGNAIVLVGNHQSFTGGADIGSSSTGGTIMSADFDLDDEPDYCLIWQLGTKTDRQSFCPIRFDFLPVLEMGLAMKEDNSTQYYSLGCYRPLGHFEVTETSLIHFGQFEFGNANRNINAPLILNGGIFDQYTKGTKSKTGANDMIDYIIIGGNVRIPSFTPGAHVNGNAKYPTRHCAVNVIGGNIDNIYLTGNYNENVPPSQDNPHCYIDGGRFKHVAAAGKEGINGDVYFKINHSKIWEFYGGSTMDQSTGNNYKIVKGSIDVTIDNSIVDKYCGGPKFGDMDYNNSKTITTNATNTIFGVYYGGGNGGTSYVQYDKSDGEQTVVANFSWGGTGKLNNYTPGSYRDEATGYMADYDMEIVNTSAGTNQNKAVYRSYFFAAQFSATNTGSIINNLTNCTVLTNFYGGGNLGGVKGNVTSTLDGTTHVYGSAFGAGYSASVPNVTIHDKDKEYPTINVYTGIITPESGGRSTTYTWTHESNLGGQTLNTSDNKTVIVNGVNYLYTTKSLDNLGAVSGAVTLTIKGNTIIDNDVFGGGDSSAVINTTTPANASTTVNLQGNALVQGNVYGGGNQGEVSGSATVNIMMPEPTP